MLNYVNVWTLAAGLYVAETMERLKNREEGQTMAEYAVILAVITAVIIGTLGVLSGKINDVLVRISAFIN